MTDTTVPPLGDLRSEDDAEPVEAHRCSFQSVGTAQERRMHDRLVELLADPAFVVRAFDLLSIGDQCCAADRELTDIVVDHHADFAGHFGDVFQLARFIEGMVRYREEAATPV